MRTCDDDVRAFIHADGVNRTRDLDAGAMRLHDIARDHGDDLSLTVCRTSNRA
jgi:hypothetical protein